MAELDRFIGNGIPAGWEDIFRLSEREIIHALHKTFEHQYRGNVIFPLYNEIFNAFTLVQPHNVRVVIFGQDPYPSLIPGTDLPVAHGFSFSARKGSPMPASLRNVFKEIQRTYPDASFANCELIQWAKQGVLLLNTSLTVNKDSPSSHEGIWIPFLAKVINYITEINPDIIFVLWGAPAKKIGDKIIPSGRMVLTSGHPSPLNRKRDFVGNGHFLQINEILTKKGEYPIDWSIYESI